MMTTTSGTDLDSMAGSFFGGDPARRPHGITQPYIFSLAQRTGASQCFGSDVGHLLCRTAHLGGSTPDRIGWFRGGEPTRKTMLVASASGLLGLLINQIIGLACLHPRPFMIGLGHTLIPHVADSVFFPSDHLTLWWAVAFSLALQRGPRIAGA